MMALQTGKWKSKKDNIFREILEYRHTAEGQRLFFTDGTQMSIDWDHDLNMLVPGNFFVVSADGAQTACSAYFGQNFLEVEEVA